MTIITSVLEESASRFKRCELVLCDPYTQKRSRQALSLCGGTECTYNTVLVDVGPAGSVGCVAHGFQVKTRL